MIRIYAANDSNVLTEITQYVNLQTDRVVSVTQNAEEQSYGSSTITFEDPTGALNLVGLRDIVVEEDSATFKRIWRGQLADRRITRGPSRTTVGRVWTADLVDLNTRMYWRVGEGNVKRPVETDVARMQYLMTQLVITDIVGDTSTYVSTANPVTMDAADYNGQYISDYVGDCIQASTAFAKNCYLLDVSDGAGGYKVAIWYGPSTLTTFTSAIKISNVLTDVDHSTVFEPLHDAELARSPSRVYSGVHVNYDGGFSYRTRGATASVYFATRDTVYDAVNIKSATKANGRGDAYLLTLSDEEDVITCTIQVPASQVNDVRAGMRIQAKFSHFTTPAADYSSDYVWFRVLNRTVTLVAPRPNSGSPAGVYEITLTLSPTTNTAPAAACSVIGAGLSLGAADTGTVAGNTSDWTTIPSPAAYPAVVLVGAFYVNGGTDIGGPTLTVNSPFTLSDGYASAAYDHSITAVAYHALSSGAPGTYRANWSGGGGSSAWDGLSIALPTAATSPVQIASQLGSGDTVNFASPLTVGNIVLLCQTQEVGGTPDPGSPPWTRIISAGFSAPFTVGTQSVAWYYMCVTSAITAVGIGDPSFTHFSFASEWALT